MAVGRGPPWVSVTALAMAGERALLADWRLGGRRRYFCYSCVDDGGGGGRGGSSLEGKGEGVTCGKAVSKCSRNEIAFLQAVLLLLLLLPRGAGPHQSSCVRCRAVIRVGRVGIWCN